MSADRELLELAAKAAGLARGRWDYDYARGIGQMVTPSMMWNPLADDGDALRLAVKLQLTVCNEQADSGVAYCIRRGDAFPEAHGAANGEDEILPDDYAATRRAIVLAAAEIGAAT